MINVESTNPSADLLSQVKENSSWGGWTIKSTDTHTIIVLPMVFNDRIITVRHGDDLSYERFWCYDKGGAAIVAALAWDGSEETEPVGWKKSWDQRRGPSSTDQS